MTNAPSASHLEVSLYSIFSNEPVGSGSTTLQAIINRLTAMGATPRPFSVHECIYQPNPEACIEPPVPSMRPALLRLQHFEHGQCVSADEATTKSFITYYGVPEHNPNRSCTVIPTISSEIVSAGPQKNQHLEHFFTLLGFSLHAELVRTGHDAQIGPFSEISIEFYQVAKKKADSGLLSLLPADTWIARLFSQCDADGRNLAERDGLLHECAKIFDDLLLFQQIDNKYFIK